MIFAEERHNKIIAMLKVNGKLLVNDLCNIFSVSAATIRSDLNMLEKKGLLTRTHGGAISRSKVAFEPTSTQKEHTCYDQKKKIAQFAASMIENGDTIALDCGTTSYCLAELLSEKQNVTVVTTDISIAAVLEKFEGISVILAGGLLRKGFSCTTGTITNSILNSLHVDKAFIATNAVSKNEILCTPNIEHASVKKSLIAMASQCFLICDSSKFGANSFARFSSIHEMHTIITDTGLDEAIAQSIKKQGIQLILV